MKNRTLNISIVLLVMVTLIASCKLQEPDIKKSTDRPLSSGNTNFTSYVALGNSLTAGYQSAALTQIHQDVCYAALIAQQMGKTQDNGFFQPLLGWPGAGSYNAAGGGIIELQGFDADGNPILVPADLGSFNPLNPYLNSDIMNHAAPYNNLGIPGIVLADLDSAISATNSYSHSPFIDVVLRNPNFGNTNPIEQALMLQPTFITCWIGNNDVLGYATSGGTSPAAPTPTESFNLLYQNLLNKLTQGSADVTVANIPDVTSVPFFTTIEYQQEVNDQMVPIQIEATGGNRSATAEDLILLTAQNVLGDVSGNYGPVGVPVGFHPSAPLPSAYVLDKDEKAIAQDAVDAYNGIIANTAAVFGAALVDANAILKEASSEHGLMIAGISFSSDFITGGLFSYDGVHPSDLGYAIVANAFIETINAYYDAYIPPIDMLQYVRDNQPVAKSVSKLSLPDLSGVVEMMGGHIK